MKQYPVNLKIDYSEISNKPSAFIRLVLVIPIIIVVALISSYAEALSLAVALMILFREKYPKWWFDWNLALTKFWLRIFAYELQIVDDDQT